MTINKLYEICERLKTTSGRKDKEQIIRDNKDDEDFKNILLFLFDSNITTGLDKKKINKDVRVCVMPDLDIDYDLEDLFDYIKKNNTGTDIDIAWINYYMWKLAELTDEYAVEDVVEFLKEIVTKTLRLGIDAKTINKVYDYNFIPTFDVQLGTPIEQCTIPENTWFSLSQKLNGTRCIYKEGKMYTRQGKEYTGLQHIINDIEQLVPNANELVFDGELILKDRSAGDSESFQISTGIANSKNATKEELKLVIFDVVPVEEFNNGESKKSYRDRKTDYLYSVRTLIQSKHLENIEVVRFFYEGYDQQEIWKWLDYAEKHDMEGCMVNLNTPYQCKRTKSLMKVKKFYDVDLLCTDIENGTGKNVNTLGNICCKYGDNIVRVGSGFSDELRNYYYTHQDEIIGKIITVKYKEITKNKQGQTSLQFPVFVCVREDKSEADA